MEYTVFFIAVVLVAAAYLLIAFSKGRDSIKLKNLTGESGIALCDIADDTPGKVKINGEEYTAKAQNDTQIPKNSKVSVKSQSGDTVVVEAVRF